MTKSPDRDVPLWSRVIEVLGSVSVAIAILCFLLVLTFLGTLDQANKSLHTVQKEYFESLFAVHTWEVLGLKIPIPLPGAYLLLALLGVNLLVGGIVRMRRTWSRVGVFIAHGGMAFLLIGGFIEFQWSDKGFMSIYEGQSASEFQSYYDWELVATEYKRDGTAREYVLADDEFKDLDEDDSVRCVSEALPFDIVLSDFLSNAGKVDPKKVRRDQWRLAERRPLHPKRGEMDMAAVTAQVIPKEGGGTRLLQLWAGQKFGARVDVAGRPWALDIRKKRWKLPFTIQLDDFQKEEHPGTSMARRYSSYVTRKGQGADEQIHITMNEPLRHEGYTLYQSSFSEGMGGVASTFSVVRNPADSIPEIACWIIAAGLLLIFLRKLILHVKAETRRHA